MRQLFKIRGIEVLELVGIDGVRSTSGDMVELDIDDNGAVGPLLRRELMKPRCDEGCSCKNCEGQYLKEDCKILIADLARSVNPIQNVSKPPMEPAIL